MEVQFTPNTSNNALALSPSHAHAREADSLVELQRLRPTSSRSPLLRQSPYKHRSTSSTRSPLSPSKRSLPSPSFTPARTPPRQSTLLTCNMPSEPRSASGVRRRPQLPRSTPLSALMRTTRSQSRSPMRSALNDSTDHGNGSSPDSLQFPSEGKENNVGLFSDGFLVPSSTLKQPRDWSIIRSSPLKRTEGAIADDTNIGSPSAKRRSLNSHLSTMGSDLEAFSRLQDRKSANNSATTSDEESAFELQSTLSALSGFRSTPNRRGKLRHGSPRCVNANRRSLELHSDPPVPARQALRRRNRFTVQTDQQVNVELDGLRGAYIFGNNNGDAHINSPEETFNYQSPNSDATGFQRQSTTETNRLGKHPLSQTISPGSPATTQDSNAFGYAHQSFQVPLKEPGEQSLDFTRSLPIGALRPTLETSTSNASQSSSTGTGFETPAIHKFAKPNPAAFRSTGLISKKHRNPDDVPPAPQAHPGMPDTPCKKLPGAFHFDSSPPSVQNMAKLRFKQPEFGTPSRPSNGLWSVNNQSVWRPSNAASFTSAVRPRFDSTSRRASLISNDGGDDSQSCNDTSQSQSSLDDLPPTPTKRANLFTANGLRSKSLRSSMFGRAQIGAETFSPPTNADGVQSYFTSHTPRSSQGTPTETALPDPSSLAISPSPAQVPVSPDLSSTWGPPFNRVPATPTAAREWTASGASGQVANLQQRLSMTPSHHTGAASVPHDVDPNLLARFKKVEWYSKGEFSEVYKVYKGTDAIQSYFSPRPRSFNGKSHAATATSPADKVYIVKKSKTPISSAKVRKRKLREVIVMKALRDSEHIVHLIDSWERHNYLYIQMEFCEEGSLAAFLFRQGRFGRLDDFRVWKILIELAEGVDYIHTNAFLHLDLKPENVFVDFAGVLKIGDFGLACEWPAPADAEKEEGDRRYMSPELLQGAFDKPADIFALGMIMYEIGGNCMLPDYGVHWHQLRSGDLSGLPSLTSGSSYETNEELSNQVEMDTSLDLTNTNIALHYDHEENVTMGNDAPKKFETVPDDDDDSANAEAGPASPSTSLPKATEYDLAQPPLFMLDPEDPQSLDSVVTNMTSPNPGLRPTAAQLLEFAGVDWVRNRKRAGATVWEGKWGPSDEVLAGIVEVRNVDDLNDEEMEDASERSF